MATIPLRRVSLVLGRFDKYRAEYLAFLWFSLYGALVVCPVDYHLYTHLQVVAHHEDLLSQVTGIEALEGVSVQADFMVAVGLHDEVVLQLMFR